MPKWPYSVCSVIGHYTCPCLVHLPVTESQTCMYCRLMLLHCFTEKLSVPGLEIA